MWSKDQLNELVRAIEDLPERLGAILREPARPTVGGGGDPGAPGSPRITVKDQYVDAMEGFALRLGQEFASFGRSVDRFQEAVNVVAGRGAMQAVTGAAGGVGGIGGAGAGGLGGAAATIPSRLEAFENARRAELERAAKLSRQNIGEPSRDPAVVALRTAADKMAKADIRQNDLLDAVFGRTATAGPGASPLDALRQNDLLDAAFGRGRGAGAGALGDIRDIGEPQPLIPAAAGGPGGGRGAAGLESPEWMLPQFQFPWQRGAMQGPPRPPLPDWMLPGGIGRLPMQGPPMTAPPNWMLPLPAFPWQRGQIQGPPAPQAPPSQLLPLPQFPWQRGQVQGPMPAIPSLEVPWKQLVLGVGAASAALLALPVTLQAASHFFTFSGRTFEQNRQYAGLSLETGSAFARYDVRKFVRDIDVAEKTKHSVVALGESQSNLEDSWTEYGTAIKNFTNRFSRNFALGAETILDIFSGIPKSINEAERPQTYEERMAEAYYAQLEGPGKLRWLFMANTGQEATLAKEMLEWSKGKDFTAIIDPLGSALEDIVAAGGLKSFR